MKINWKARFSNGVWLTSFLSTIVLFAYEILKQFDIVPDFTQEMALKLVQYILMLLSVMGVITDPTTSGVGDSKRAQGYSAPWNDAEKDGGQKTEAK